MLWSGPTTDVLCALNAGDATALLRVRTMRAPGEGDELAWAERTLLGAEVCGTRDLR